MKKKLLTLVTLAMLGIGSAWAEEKLMVSWNTAPTCSNDNTDCTTTGTAKNLATWADGTTIKIMRSDKGMSNGSDITINGKKYTTIKVSNGAQNKLTMPSGKFAYSVDFYSYVNKNQTGDYYWKEVNGSSYSEPKLTCLSNGDLTKPDKVSFSLGGVSSFTFNNAGTQLCYVLAITTTPITGQPESAEYGQNSTPEALTVTASSTAGTLTYQWYSCADANKTSAAAIAGATNASYSNFSTEETGTFYYYCVVTDNNGSFSSDVATITISSASAPTISVTPTTPTVFQGTSVTLTAEVSGVPAPSIQWYSCDDASKTNAVAIAGATNTTYSPSTTTSGNYYFYAVATNASGNASSDVVTLTVNPLFSVTYSIGSETGVEGSVPAVVQVESSVTIPANQTLYKPGYTLTGWNDGTTTHAAGEEVAISANTTLTAEFTENAVELGMCPATVTWQFQTGQGAPTWAYEGDPAFKYVAQMNLGGTTIDMPLTMDPSNGKIANANWADWTQLNKNTKLTVPVLKGSVLELYVFNEAGEGKIKTSFEGNTGSYASNIYTYTATASGVLEIVIGEESYYRYLTVTYPMEGVVIYDYATSVGTGTPGSEKVSSQSSQTINGSKPNAIKMESSLTASAKTNYWKITPSAGTFKKGDRISWTGCYSNSATKTTTVVIYDDDAISNPIVTGDNFANVNGGSAASPKPLTSGYFTLTADADALYIGRSGGTTTYVTGLTVVRNQEKGKITDSGYNTFSSPCALDLSTIENGIAYVATSVTDGKVVLSKSTAIVAAGTGIMIAGAAGADFTIATTANTATLTGDNLLVGMPNGGEVAKAADGEYNYVFGWTDPTNPGFYLVNAEAATLPSFKAYLHTTSALTAPSTARLGIVFADEATGINTIDHSSLTIDSSVFDLQGRHVAQPTKGLYIVNGKKVVIK